jgi:hypothetical protein
MVLSGATDLSTLGSGAPAAHPETIISATSAAAVPLTLDAILRTSAPGFHSSVTDPGKHKPRR